MFFVPEIASHMLFRSHDPGAAPGIRAITLGIIVPVAVALAPGMHAELDYTRLTYPALLEVETWFDDPVIAIEYTRRNAAAPAGHAELRVDTGMIEITALPGGEPEDVPVERDDSMITVAVDEVPIFFTPIDPGDLFGLIELIDTTWHGGGAGDGGESGGAAGGGGGSFDGNDPGSNFVSIPEPGVAGTLALGAIATTRRRRGA